VAPYDFSVRSRILCHRMPGRHVLRHFPQDTQTHPGPRQAVPLPPSHPLGQARALDIYPMPAGRRNGGPVRHRAVEHRPQHGGRGQSGHGLIDMGHNRPRCRHRHRRRDCLRHSYRRDLTLAWPRVLLALLPARNGSRVPAGALGDAHRDRPRPMHLMRQVRGDMPVTVH